MAEMRTLIHTAKSYQHQAMGPPPAPRGQATHGGNPANGRQPALTKREEWECAACATRNFVSRATCRGCNLTRTPQCQVVPAGSVHAQKGTTRPRDQREQQAPLTSNLHAALASAKAANATPAIIQALEEQIAAETAPPATTSGELLDKASATCSQLQRATSKLRAATAEVATAEDRVESLKAELEKARTTAAEAADRQAIAEKEVAEAQRAGAADHLAPIATLSAAAMEVVTAL